jgi:hypothetical protein
MRADLRMERDGASRGCQLPRLIKRFPQKAGDRSQHAVIHFVLARSQRLQGRFRDDERVVAFLDNIERRGRMHPLANALEKIERTEGVARSLHEQDRSLQLQENLIAKPRSVARAAERIAEADYGLDRLDERDMAADAPAHAFAGERDRAGMPGAKRGERRSMRRDELGQRVRPASTLQCIRIIEGLDRADRPQELGKSLHPRMRGGCAGARREEKGWFGHARQSIGLGKLRQPVVHLLANASPKRRVGLIGGLLRFGSLRVHRARRLPQK